MAAIEIFLGLPHEISETNFHFDEEKGFYCPQLVEGQVECLGNDKGHSHPQLSEKALKILRKFYKEHNKNFYDLVGQNFGWTEE